MLCLLGVSGLKKSSGKVDFLAEQLVTFNSHLCDGQDPGQVVCQLNQNKSKLRLA